MESSYSRLDIVKRILESSQRGGGAPEPRLMYSSYLSYLQIDEYLSLMLSSGLLRYDRETRAYRITAKGIDFLSSIRQMDYFMKTIEE
ncbi:MAG: winged helix-turn-helix domain-containing protein [Nitrososphaera sp.]|nr:winged helix-turn-helix domain-containing protein [Nitrososphaera sp.]